MLSVSIVDPVAVASVLAMFVRIRNRVNSAGLAAVPTTISTLATSLRSVLAVRPSQKMLMPPATMGMEAVSVVFICMGSSPSLGVGPAVPPTAGFVSSALMTIDTNTF
eukprot:2476398-Rhodomonas_salina.2